MIACPRCGGSTSVTETRVSGRNARRRRKCACGERVTTIELIVPERYLGGRWSERDLVVVRRADLEASRVAIGRALGDAPPVASESVSTEPTP